LHERYVNRLTLTNPRLIERYLKEELLIPVRFCIRGVDIEYVACFQRESVGGSNAINAEVAEGDIFATCNSSKSRGRPRLIVPISKLRVPYR
jgi:hypothetical protein